MSTRGDLTISKNLVGDCAVENGDEIDPGDDVTYELCIENTTPDEQTVDIYDALNPYTMAALVWSGVDVGSGATTGSAGGGADLIDETLVLEPCAKFVYTIVVTTLDPFCGTMSNCARYCTPDMKRPVSVSSPPVYVGLSKGETCLDHESHNLNDALYELMPSEGRASKLFDFIEAGYDLVDILEAVSKFITGDDSPAKPINPEYTPAKEAAEQRAALAKRQADAEARRQAAVDAAGNTAARAAE